MKSLTLVILIQALFCGSALAQDGGKVTWLGKDQEIRTALDDARAIGRPMMLLFSLQGDKDCLELSQGALSHPAVVDASAAVTCIFVECSNRKNATFASQLNITKLPAIVFADAGGVTLGKVQARDGPGLAAALQELNRQATLLPRFNQDLDKALANARRTGQLLLIYFFDDSPGCLTINKSLADLEVRPLGSRFEFAMSPLEKGGALSTKYDVDRAPTLLVLNPRLSKPEAKPVARISSPRSPRELRRDLEEALEAAKSAGGDTADPVTAVPLPPVKEQLSDDEIDRKFIQARMAVAAGLAKRGMKDKAIDVLEDVIQTYPKHVLTKDARAMLEQIRK